MSWVDLDMGEVVNAIRGETDASKHLATIAKSMQAIQAALEGIRANSEKSTKTLETIALHVGRLQ